MGRFDGVLLASDLDGTLIGPDRTISAENIDALRYFVQEGGLFTAATGRAPFSGLPYLDGLPVNAPVMFLNGALLWDAPSKRPVYAVPLGGEEESLAAELADRFPHIGIEVYTPESAYLCRDSAASRRRMARFGIPMRESAPADVPAPRLTLLVTGEPGTLDPVFSHMRRHHADRYASVLSFPSLLEINNVRANKGLTLHKLAALCGVADRDIYAAGDSYNDLDMLRMASHAFVPADGAQEALDAAGTVVAPSSAHSLRDVVAALDARYSQHAHHAP